MIDDYSILSEKYDNVFCSDDCKYGLSFNPDVGIFDGATVVISAIQIALMLGYKRIFIFGMDLSISNGVRCYHEKVVEKSFLDRDYNTLILPWFKFFSSVIPSLNIEVFNMSSGSRLPASVIPKIE